ncbi:glycosyltransferase [Algoriphagus winogradskyi]|uniref:Rhamnosyl transferase n=1 Tax=Algoriphagus winogradskyi TaxID=237017 RepID=A0ABY1NWY5_9BACT|nr:glycosyltransferase [Algoriphagus winogradskyi]SMP19839.1 Putative rhamnosyl transferase [Algoriphagus winogradskyi]
MRINHFVFTRFNLGYIDYYNVKNPEEWLLYRMNLFYKYTYPTLTYQSEKNFKWVVLFDVQTPSEFIDKFLIEDFESIISIGYTTIFDLSVYVKNYIKNYSKKEDILISTTLDSDDGLLPDFIHTIQNFVLTSDFFPYGINIKDGYIVDISTGFFHNKSFYSNPFYSLVENQGNALGIYCFSHHILKEKFVTFDIDNSRLWLQNIHSSNLLNTIKGNVVINYSGIDLKVLKLYRSRNFFSLLIMYLFFFKRMFYNFLVKIKIFND